MRPTQQPSERPTERPAAPTARPDATPDRTPEPERCDKPATSCQAPGHAKGVATHQGRPAAGKAVGEVSDKVGDTVRGPVGTVQGLLDRRAPGRH